MAKAELGVILQSLSGKAGTAVFARSKEGIILKPRVKGRNPNTPAQQAIRADLRTSATTFKNFTTAQLAPWKVYANSITKHNDVTGKTYHPSAMNAFIALATKFLQVTPGGTIPTTPPASAFVGDAVSIQAAPGTGKITFTASAPNAANVVTEFLLQPLASANRAPQAHAYRSHGFFAFVPGTLTHDVTVPPGYYAAAYRFVNSATGQESGIVALDVEQVAFALSGKKAA